MNLDYFALVMGLTGSLHCAAMCGPIILSSPFAKENKWSLTYKFILYHLGRVFVYVWLGLLVFSIGSTFSVFADQKVLSLALGLVLIIFSVAYFTGAKMAWFSKFQNKMVIAVSSFFGTFVQSSLFPLLAGMMNGLIPCGMIYVALGIVSNAGTAGDAASFMLYFGIGTIPLLLVMSFGGSFLKRRFKFRTQRFVPIVALLMGVLFISRSLQLDIPFLSPPIVEAINSFCGVN